MTPYQLAAFLYPCTAAGDENRPNAGTAEQLARTGPGAPVAPVTHWERGYRVTMIADAMPGSAGVAEGWPMWHISVTLHGALSHKSRSGKGKAHAERALGNWGFMREQGALHIIRRELAGVGVAGTEVIVGKAEALRMFAEAARAQAAAGRPGFIQPPVAVFGRKKMTLDEALRCLGAQDDLEVQWMLDPGSLRERALPAGRPRTGFDLLRGAAEKES